jgi:hypothetical protein
MSWYTIHRIKGVNPEKGEYRISTAMVAQATSRKKAKAAATWIASGPGPHWGTGMVIWDHTKGIDGLMVWDPIAGIVDFANPKPTSASALPPMLKQPRTVRWEYGA